MEGTLTSKILKTILGIQYRTIEYTDSHEENSNWIVELFTIVGSNADLLSAVFEFALAVVSNASSN